MTSELNGLIGIIKPTGMYSGKVLGKVKNLLWNEFHPTGKKLPNEPKLPKVGHMGTLDPDAEGVLVVGIGKALKGFNKFLNKEKTYETIFKFGVETDTLDHTGTITKNEELKIKNIKKFRESTEAAIKTMTGKQLQTPPLVSAVHFNGIRGYDLARTKNKEPKTKSCDETENIHELLKSKAKPITIHSFKLLGQISESEFKFEIICSSGTYIRAIARDLAKKLDTVAITTKINRTQCGRFNYLNSVRFEDLNYTNLKSSLK